MVILLKGCNLPVGGVVLVKALCAAFLAWFFFYIENFPDSSDSQYGSFLPHWNFYIQTWICLQSGKFWVRTRVSGRIGSVRGSSNTYNSVRLSYDYATSSVTLTTEVTVVNYICLHLHVNCQDSSAQQLSSSAALQLSISAALQLSSSAANQLNSSAAQPVFSSAAHQKENSSSSSAYQHK